MNAPETEFLRLLERAVRDFARAEDTARELLAVGADALPGEYENAELKLLIDGASNLEDGLRNDNGSQNGGE